MHTLCFGNDASAKLASVSSEGESTVFTVTACH